MLAWRIFDVGLHEIPDRSATGSDGSGVFGVVVHKNVVSFLWVCLEEDLPNSGGILMRALPVELAVDRGTSGRLLSSPRRLKMALNRPKHQLGTGGQFERSGRSSSTARMNQQLFAIYQGHMFQQHINQALAFLLRSVGIAP